MKKWPLFLGLYFCLCLLAACAAGGSGAPVPGGTPSEEPQPGGETAQPAMESMICRVVDEEKGGMLLLAEQNGSGVYTVNTAGKLCIDGKNIDLAEPGAYQDLPNWALVGALVEVSYSGDIMESYPAQFGGEATVTVLSDGFDDRCALYLEVLNDLWEVDPGLNSDGMTYVGVDLSRTSLSESERAAVAWAFAGGHGAEPVQGTWDELVEQGYITASPLMVDRSDTKVEAPTRYFYEWEDGCLFTIAESEEAVVYNEPALAPGEQPPIQNMVRFNAQKWRSSLGAYFFSDCTARRSAGGRWGEYTVGSEAIS